MPKALKGLPFDQKNQRDFVEMTERIRDGLDSIRNSKSLKPTQNTLAQLAHCSRRTLNLRRWPIAELNTIKEDRAAKDKDKPFDATTGKKKDKQSESQLITLIRKYQSENGKLFDRVQYLEEAESRSAVIKRTLEEQLATVSEKVRQLEQGSPMTHLALVRD